VINFFNDPANINKSVNWLIGIAVAALVIWGYTSYTGNIDSQVYKSMASAKEKMNGNDTETAILNFKTITRDYPTSTHTGEVYYLLGQCYEKSKNTDEAVKAYSEALKKHLPEELKPAAYISCAYAYEAKGDYVKAASVLDELLKKMPKYYGAGEAMLDEARNLRLAGKDAEARAKYKEITEKFPESSWAVSAKPYAQ
jgi:TolA-binding protein